MVRSIANCLVLAAATTVALLAAVPQAVPASVLVDRAGRYAEAYEQAFSAVVSEEHQIQKLLRADGRVQVRDLRSDFLLVKTATGILAFRDVFSVDRKSVRPRGDRLRRVFLDAPRTAVEQARAIAAESERHNIGMPRTTRSPLLPLAFVKPGASSGFRFTAAKDGTVAFQEIRTPGVLAEQTRGTRFTVMTKGTLQIETENGRLLAADFTAQGPPQVAALSLAVRYRLDKTLDVMVPVSVTERHWVPNKPKDDRLEVTSSYSNFRQFEVAESRKPQAANAVRR